MFIEIIEPDGSIIDSLEIRKGRAVLSADDARRHDRRTAYFQQRHVQRALRNECIILKKKEHKVIKVDDGLKFIDITVDKEGCPSPSLCCRFTIPTLTGATIKSKSVDGKNVCHVSGLMRCGSVWTCPVCGRKILKEREKEIEQAVEFFGDSKNRMFMVTLTARHKKTTDLRSFAKSFRNARRRVSRNRSYIQFRRQCAGYITAAEITWSEKNGWHWHVHELWFDCPFAPDFSDLWQESLKKEGLSCIKSRGYDVRETFNASEYMSKWKSERTWTPGKEVAGVRKGQAVWDLAPTRYDLVAEHYHATRGMRRISWSKGLKKLVGLNEKSTGELLDEGEAEDIVHIPTMVWAQIHRNGLIPDVLECAEFGGSHLVVETIQELIESKWSVEIIKEQRHLRAKLGTF
jgi:hypothetical protein